MSKQDVTVLGTFKADSLTDKVIYVFLTAARKLEIMGEFVDELEKRGAKVCVFATENARKMLADTKNQLLKKVIKGDSSPQSVPEEDLLVVVPCTFNTVVKLAAGLADSHELTLVQTAISKGKKVIIVPAYNELWFHPQNQSGIGKLQEWGVQFVLPVATQQKVTMMALPKVLDVITCHFMKIKFNSLRLGGEDVEKRYLSAVKAHYPTFKNIGEEQEALGTNSSKHGCYSVEVDNDWILITCSGSYLGNLEPEDLTLLHKASENGHYRWVGSKPPSSESPLHLAIYTSKKAKAVAHSHCPAITYNPSLEHLMTEQYIPYGESETVQQIEHLFRSEENFFILRYHGEVAYAKTLDAACKLIHQHLGNYE